MGKKVALLDVDDTLLIVRDKKQMNAVLNMDLINALLSQGIKDIYLFTDMSFDSIALKEREKLVEDIAGMGFTVHAVMTPFDYAWSLDKKTATELSAAFDKSGIRLGQSAQEHQDPKQMHTFNEFFAKEIEPLLERSNFNDSSLGCAFADAIGTIDYNDNPELGERDRSNVCKLISDIISIQKGYASIKGQMLDHFLHHMRDAYSSIFVFDDRKENITAVQEAAANHPGIFVHGITIDRKQPQNTDELVNLINQSKEHVIERIDKMLARMKSVKMGSRQVKDEKEQALTLLRNAILNPTVYPQAKTTSQTIQAWLDDTSHFAKHGNAVPISEIIDTHRNILSNQKTPTKTRELVNQMLKEQIDQPVEALESRSPVRMK